MEGPRKNIGAQGASQSEGSHSPDAAKDSKGRRVTLAKGGGVQDQSCSTQSCCQCGKEISQGSKSASKQDGQISTKRYGA